MRVRSDGQDHSGEGGQGKRQSAVDGTVSDYRDWRRWISKNYPGVRFPEPPELKLPDLP